MAFCPLPPPLLYYTRNETKRDLITPELFTLGTICHRPLKTLTPWPGIELGTLCSGILPITITFPKRVTKNVHYKEIRMNKMCFVNYSHLNLICLNAINSKFKKNKKIRKIRKKKKKKITLFKLFSNYCHGINRT